MVNVQLVRLHAVRREDTVIGNVIVKTVMVDPLLMLSMSMLTLMLVLLVLVYPQHWKKEVD